MTINTGQFGEIAVDGDSVITFVQPIIGFDQYRKFLLVEDETFFPIQWIQSVEDPDLAFPVIDPALLNIKYDLGKISDAVKSLGLVNCNDVVTYTMLVIPSSRIDEVRTNLKAPLVINADTRVGMQVVYENEGYPVRHFLFRGKEINRFEDECVAANVNA